MRAQMEKQMRLIKEMQVKLDVRESEASRYQQELAKMKGMIQAEKQKNNNIYLDDFVHAQEKALHAEIDDELTRLLEEVLDKIRQTRLVPLLIYLSSIHQKVAKLFAMKQVG